MHDLYFCVRSVRGMYECGLLYVSVCAQLWWFSGDVVVMCVCFSGIRYLWIVGGNMSLTSALLRSKFLKFALRYIKLIVSLRVLCTAEWLNNCSDYWHGFDNRFMSLFLVWKWNHSEI
jgi:hypothetical protein